MITQLTSSPPPIVELLPVPGARLYTETCGAGPLLVCIVGGNGDAEIFGRIAAALAGQFTVVTYDRRGFARSPIDNVIDDASRLAIDSDDAVRVIEHHGGGPAHVFGSSSGAIVGLDLITRAPRHVRTLVAHEPPITTLLPDAERWLAGFDDVHAAYLASGAAAAMTAFHAHVGLPAMPAPPPGMVLPPPVAAMLARMPDNQGFWLEHELRSYPRFVPDLAALGVARGRLVLGVGRATGDGVLARPARALAALLAAPVAEFAGGHVGYATDPVEFAAQLAARLGASAASGPG